MNILLVSATGLEIRPLLDRLDPVGNQTGALRHFRLGGSAVDTLVTGIGMVATAWQLGKTFAEGKYDLALNAGICGSFRTDLPPGTVVNVVSDCFPELGAEEDDRFRTLSDLGLQKANDPPFTGDRLIPAPTHLLSGLTALPRAAGITANTIHCRQESIERLRHSWNPDIETMEGAAFFYACISAGIPCLQIRAVSNFVEIRDKSKWNIPLAVKNLNEWLIDGVMR